MKIFSGIHVIISGFGSAGDIHPLLAIAAELKSRGASNITFLVNDYYCDMVAQYGFKYIATGTKEHQIEYTNDKRVWDNKIRHDAAEIGWVNLARPAMETAYQVVENAHKAGDKILVLGLQSMMNGACMAAEALGLPMVHITLAPQLLAIYSNLAPPPPVSWYMPDWFPSTLKRKHLDRIHSLALKLTMERDYFWQLNGMRRFRGLKPAKDFSANTVLSKKFLQIALFPNWFGMPASDWPDNVHLTAFPIFDIIKTKANADVEQFINEQGSPVVFTFGTGFSDTLEIFKTGLEACEKLGCPGLFIGGDVDEDFITSKKYMHIRHIDLKSILPKCSAIVHHGGIGTLAQAIRAGIPQLIRPQAFDQFDNADRIYTLGLGSFILAKKFKVKNVVRVLDEILKSQLVRVQTKYFASLINSSNPMERTCDLIEDFMITPKEGRCVHPLNRAIIESCATTQDIQHPNIPLLKIRTRFVRKAKRDNGNHEALFMLCNYYGRHVSCRDLHRQYPKEMNLSNMIEACTQLSLKARAVQCSAEYLTDIKLPCLVQWQLNRFIVLVGFDKDKTLIRDPVLEQQEYPIHEFAWNYSETAIEITE